MATEHLRTSGKSQGVVAEQLKQTLEGSAKPLRDPSRVRPGTGRGKSSRRTRWRTRAGAPRRACV